MKNISLLTIILMLSIAFLVFNCSSDDKKDNESKTKKEDIKKSEMTKKDDISEDEGSKKPVRKMNPVQFAEIKIALEDAKTEEEKEKKLAELLKKFDLTMSNYNDFKESLSSDPVAQTHVKSAYDALKQVDKKEAKKVPEKRIKDNNNKEKGKAVKDEQTKKTNVKKPAKAIKKADPKKRPAKPSVKKGTKKAKTPDELKKEGK